jgi:hypothetical protein
MGEFLESRYALVITQSVGSVQWRLTPFTAVCWHTNNQPNTTTARRHVPKKHIHKKPILPTYTIKMEGGGNVLQGHHIRGRAISHDAFIILHSQQRNWYLYHNITTKLLWKKHNISTKMIPFGACRPFLLNHHNILIDKEDG